MSKGILVTDMPKTCYGCELAHDDGFCWWVDKYIDHYDVCEKQRCPTCPLVPIPDKITEATYTDDNTSELDYAAGWNACIDAMMGGIGEK